MVEQRYIPMDILLSILVRVPASSLRRLKSVSKEWLRIISNPDFGEAHFTLQSQEEFGSGVFINTTKGIFFLEGTSSPTPTVPKYINFPGSNKRSIVLGSCKGLVLYSSREESVQLHVVNPISGESRTIPPFRRNIGQPMCASIESCGVEIKVVVLFKQLNPTPITPFICGIITLGLSSWREIVTPVYGNRLENPFVYPTFSKGAFHWCYDTGILSLDLRREKFHQTEVTFCSSTALKHDAGYIQWDGCYGVIFLNRGPSTFYTVWLLKESGWQKQPDIDSAFYERLGYSTSENLPALCRASMRNGKILFFLHVTQVEVSMLVYDLDSQSMSKFAQMDMDFCKDWKAGARCCIVPHVNSLVSYPSSPVAPTMIGIFLTGAIMFCLVFHILSKILSDFTCSMKNLFGI